MSNNSQYAWSNLDLSYLKSGIYYDKSQNINKLDKLAQAFQAKTISVDNEDTIIKIVGEKNKSKTLVISNGNLVLSFDDNVKGIKVKEPNTALMRVNNSNNASNASLYLTDESNTISLSNNIVLNDVAKASDITSCFLRKSSPLAINMYVTTNNSNNSVLVSQTFTKGKTIWKKYAVPRYKVNDQSIGSWGPNVLTSKKDMQYKYETPITYYNSQTSADVYNFNFNKYYPLALLSNFYDLSNDNYTIKITYNSTYNSLDIYKVDKITSSSNDSSFYFLTRVIWNKTKDKLVLYMRKPTSITFINNKFSDGGNFSTKVEKISNEYYNATYKYLYLGKEGNVFQPNAEEKIVINLWIDIYDLAAKLNNNGDNILITSNGSIYRNGMSINLTKINNREDEDLGIDYGHFIINKNLKYSFTVRKQKESSENIGYYDSNYVYQYYNLTKKISLNNVEFFSNVNAPTWNTNISVTDSDLSWKVTTTTQPTWTSHTWTIKENYNIQNYYCGLFNIDSYFGFQLNGHELNTNVNYDGERYRYESTNFRTSGLDYTSVYQNFHIKGLHNNKVAFALALFTTKDPTSYDNFTMEDIK